MKFLWNTDVFGWRMTGIIGAKCLWFLGFSRAPVVKDGDSVTIRIERKWTDRADSRKAA